MFKLFILLSLCAACAYAAPSLPHYASWPAVHHAVVHPIWTTHSIVRPIVHRLGHHHGYVHGHGWI